MGFLSNVKRFFESLTQIVKLLNEINTNLILLREEIRNQNITRNPEHILKKESFTSDVGFIPIIDTEGLIITGDKSTSKKVSKNFDEISKKIRETSNE